MQTSRTMKRPVFDPNPVFWNQSSAPARVTVRPRDVLEEESEAVARHISEVEIGRKEVYFSIPYMIFGGIVGAVLVSTVASTEEFNAIKITAFVIWALFALSWFIPRWKCQSCKKQVSVDAKRCHHCTTRFK